MTLTESRRRRGGLELHDDEREAIGTVLKVVNKKKRPAKRQAWEKHELSDLSLFLFCLGMAIVIYTMRFRLQDSAKHLSMVGVSNEFRTAFYESRKRILPAYKVLYDAYYKLTTERLHPPDETPWPEHERNPYELKSTYGPNIQQCPLTIVVLNTKLGKPIYDYGPGQPLWFELESIAAFEPDACVVLHTATCAMGEYLGKDKPDDVLQDEIVKVIYNNALPLFRRMIESGRVRISFLNYKEYHLQTCRELENPSVVFMNRNYWEHEFLPADNDTILIHQDGASLCYPLTDLTSLRSMALVGSLWPHDPNPLIPEPLEGPCRGMGVRWKAWLRPQRRWELQQKQQMHPEVEKKQHQQEHHPAPKPRQLLSEDFPAICKDGRGPVGHGGMSLRSRQWMIQAVETCPHITHSGLAKVEDEPFACKVFEEVSHDFYFGTVLAGIDAPLPTALEASLFATQSLWPEQAWNQYGLLTDDKILKASRPTISVAEEEITIPNVLINPWWYHPNEVLRSEAMNHACPYLSYTFTPEMSRYEESRHKAHPNWAGIGH